MMLRVLWLAYCVTLTAAADIARSRHNLRLSEPPASHIEPESASLVKQSPLALGDLHELVCYLKSTLGRHFTPEKKPAVMKEGTQSCAVVSSSGAMLEHTHGQDINGHDIVIRFNGAPTSGFEPHVGGKTDVRFGWKFHEFEGDANIFKSAAFPSKTAQQVMDHLYPEQIGVSANARTDHPTTGFYGMMMALFNCATVDAYEMAPSSKARTSPYSYFQAVGGRATHNSWHGHFESEHDLWQRLSATPAEEIMNSGKSHYVGFRDVQCDAAAFAQSNRTMLAMQPNITVH
mmetsp:Transcript_11661/g.26371  ORF Transcript_11661/g.26371 Transcript_11661/m.26371 type:complete len:289 (+) Transcript_11661:95-961(+)